MPVDLLQPYLVAAEHATRIACPAAVKRAGFFTKDRRPRASQQSVKLALIGRCPELICAGACSAGHALQDVAREVFVFDYRVEALMYVFGVDLLFSAGHLRGAE